ncbi:MAG: NAD(P)H-hydrate dehydratase [Candidatus Hadarchaeota archaeon]
MAESYAGGRDAFEVLPKRSPDSHKGDHGRLLVVGGSSRYVGAPAMVGLAALRSGVDLATIAAPEKVAWAINSISPDLITIKLMCEDIEPRDVPGLVWELERATAVVVGPGLGTLKKTRKAVLGLAVAMRKKYPKLPALFDADGLKALASGGRLTKGMPWVLTPHAGEFKILTGLNLPSDLQGCIKMVKSAARKFGCVILLKGQIDIIASPAGNVNLNSTGNPGMTVGGTGDVLAGIVGAFLSQGAKPFKAAVAGAWINGRAGDLCLKEKGYEFIASDLIAKLPDVFAEIRGRKR